MKKNSLAGIIVWGLFFGLAVTGLWRSFFIENSADNASRPFISEKRAK
ncbi:hypothetical protein [uncultured Bilophila sp.]|nr:hypothetical protein [uncultured Bilophila sp.]